MKRGCIDNHNFSTSAALPTLSSLCSSRYRERSRTNTDVPMSTLATFVEVEWH